MNAPSHPIWFILFMVVVLTAGLIYCQLAYANGSDVPKDSVLIAGVRALVGLWFKFTSASRGDS